MNLETLFERAHLLLQQKRYKDAEGYIKQALEQNPNDSHAFGLLARCYVNTKQYAKGIEAAKQAIALDPNDSFYHYILGFAHYHKDERSAAQGAFQRAISLNPYEAEYFGMLAFVLLDDRRFNEALQKADEGLALEADNLTCLNARSTALNKLKQTDAAFETMNTALAQAPDSEVTHNTVGWNLLERGQHRDAESHFVEALRINPNYASAQQGLKESLKARLLLYKWLLQYSFWMQNRGRQFQWALPIGLYIGFRVLSKVAESNKGTEGLAWVFGGIYLFIVVVSWTISSIANFVLLFHPQGRHALTHSEKLAARLVVAALGLGLLLGALGFTSLLADTPYEPLVVLAVMVCVSLALPLGHVQYPLRFKGSGWREKFGIGLIAAGALALLVFFALPELALPLFGVYGLGFLVYNWTGLGR